MRKSQAELFITMQRDASLRNRDELAVGLFIHAQSEFIALFEAIKRFERTFFEREAFHPEFSAHRIWLAYAPYTEPQEALKVYTEAAAWLEAALLEIAGRSKRRRAAALLVIAYMKEVLERVAASGTHVSPRLKLLARHFELIYFHDEDAVRRARLLASPARALRDRAFMEGVSLELFEEYMSAIQEGLAEVPTESANRVNLDSLEDQLRAHFLLEDL